MITFAHNLIQVFIGLSHSPLLRFLALVGLLMIAVGIVWDVLFYRAPVDTELWPPDPKDPDYDLYNE